MHLYDDIEDASLSLLGSTSSSQFHVRALSLKMIFLIVATKYLRNYESQLLA